MLTKDLTKAHARKDRIVPLRIKVDDKEAAEDIAAVCGLFQHGIGCTEAELRAQLEPFPQGNRGIVLQGLFKLQNDRCKYEEASAEVKEQRWDAFMRAQDLRENNVFESGEEYRDAVGEMLQKTPLEISETLYDDLPALRKIKETPKISVDGLRARYNCAQIQAQLLRAASLEVDLTNATVAEMRYLLRQSRFHRLMVEPIDDSGKVWRLNGPMTVLDKAQNYGDRLSKFFPHILTLAKFKVTAHIERKNKEMKLVVDHKMKYVAPIDQSASHIPPEFTKMFKAVAESRRDWQLEMGGALVNLGEGNYLLPDFIVSKKSQKSIYIELCHRWHRSGLERKLSQYEESALDIRLGLSRDLAKKKEVKPIIEGSAWFQKHGFLFADFPTSSQLIKAIES